MLSNGKPMKIELLGRLVSDWEEFRNGEFCYNSIAINKSAKTYFIKLIGATENVHYLKGQKVIISGNIMSIECYNNIPRLTVFVEVITLV